MPEITANGILIGLVAAIADWDEIDDVVRWAFLEGELDYRSRNRLGRIACEARSNARNGGEALRSLGFTRRHFPVGWELPF